MSGVYDIYMNVAEALESAAPSVFGLKERSRHAAPPRYAWVPRNIGQEGATSVGGNPRSVGDDMHTVEIECWGADYSECYRLRQALVTALRTVVRGRSYELGETVCGEPDDMTFGYIMIVSIVIRLSCISAELPSQQGAPIADDVQPTTNIEDLGWSDALAVPGDGILDPME